MRTQHDAATVLDPVAGAVGSIEGCDDDQSAALAPRYCPTGLLAGFALLMAGHARCVNTSMMLGDREYAMWQLACAQALGDAELTAVAKRLFGYFDDPQHRLAMPARHVA